MLSGLTSAAMYAALKVANPVAFASEKAVAMYGEFVSRYETFMEELEARSPVPTTRLDDCPPIGEMAHSRIKTGVSTFSTRRLIGRVTALKTVLEPSSCSNIPTVAPRSIFQDAMACKDRPRTAANAIGNIVGPKAAAAIKELSSEFADPTGVLSRE